MLLAEQYVFLKIRLQSPTNFGNPFYLKYCKCTSEKATFWTVCVKTMLIWKTETTGRHCSSRHISSVIILRPSHIYIICPLRTLIINHQCNQFLHLIISFTISAVYSFGLWMECSSDYRTRKDLH